MLLVLGGFAAFTAADTSFAYLNAFGKYGTGNFLDAGWFAGFLLIALGAVAAHTESPIDDPPRSVPAIEDVAPYQFANMTTVVWTPRLADLMVNGLAIVLIIADAAVSLYDLGLMLRSLA